MQIGQRDVRFQAEICMLKVPCRDVRATSVSHVDKPQRAICKPLLTTPLNTLLAALIQALQHSIDVGRT